MKNIYKFMNLKCLFLALYFAIASAIMAAPPSISVDIQEDKFGRPTAIICYYIDATGKKVKHGRCITYDWKSLTKTDELFEHGRMRESTLGDFGQSEGGLPIPKR